MTTDETNDEADDLSENHVEASAKCNSVGCESFVVPPGSNNGHPSYDALVEHVVVWFYTAHSDEETPTLEKDEEELVCASWTTPCDWEGSHKESIATMLITEKDDP